MFMSYRSYESTRQTMDICPQLGGEYGNSTLDANGFQEFTH